MPEIDASARIDPEADLADDVRVGPYSIIGPNVRIGPGTQIGPHVVISGHTTIGRDNQICQFASIGEAPQHRAYKGEPTRVEIGDGNLIREFCSIHRGTTFDDGVTVLGNNNLLMAYVHVAHDCVLEDGITMANGASVAGHVRVGSGVVFGGFALVHQFCRVGRFAFLGHSAGVLKDVPPFVRCAGYLAKPYGINSLALRRAGFDNAGVAEVKRVYKLIYRSKLRLTEARERLAKGEDSSEIAQEVARFLTDTKRGIIR